VISYSHPCDKCGGTHQGTCTSHLWGLAQAALWLAAFLLLFAGASAVSLGFMKPFPKFVFGSSEKAFGTPGLGGSFGFADPDTGIGFAFRPPY